MSLVEMKCYVVTYIFRPGDAPMFGLMPGHCVMSLEQASALQVAVARQRGHLHKLKCLEPYWTELASGRKKHELRKDDRIPRYEVDHVLKIERYLPNV